MNRLEKELSGQDAFKQFVEKLENIVNISESGGMNIGDMFKQIYELIESAKPTQK